MNLQEDLERIAANLTDNGVQEVWVETRQAVYVDFGFREALTVEPSVDSGRWCVIANEWDASGGLAVETEIAVCTEAEVLGEVQKFLAMIAENERRQEEIERSYADHVQWEIDHDNEQAMLDRERGF